MNLAFLLQKRRQRLDLIRGKYQSPRECFGSFFTSKQRHQLSIMKSHGSAGAYNHELYNCDVVVSACQDVILLELESNGTKTTIENKKRVKHPNHPYCRVIIDNREGYPDCCHREKCSFFGRYRQGCLSFAERL